MANENHAVLYVQLGLRMDLLRGTNAAEYCREAFLRVLHLARLPEIVGGVENGHDALRVLELHRLGASLLFGHVVHAEELVVAEEDALHR